MGVLPLSFIYSFAERLVHKKDVPTARIRAKTHLLGASVSSTEGFEALCAKVLQFPNRKRGRTNKGPEEGGEHEGEEHEEHEDLRQEDGGLGEDEQNRQKIKGWYTSAAYGVTNRSFWEMVNISSTLFKKLARLSNILKAAGELGGKRLKFSRFAGTRRYFKTSRRTM